MVWSRAPRFGSLESQATTPYIWVTTEHVRQAIGVQVMWFLIQAIVFIAVTGKLLAIGGPGTNGLAAAFFGILAAKGVTVGLLRLRDLCCPLLDASAPRSVPPVHELIPPRSRLLSEDQTRHLT